MSAFNFRKAYEDRENRFRADLGVSASGSAHGPTKGSASESNWRKALKDFLPKRYGVGTGFVCDSTGGLSLQNDIIIYDQQYSPLFYELNDVLTVPAECVYAVFEVKQKLSGSKVKEAREKAASVRGLTRTSVEVVTAGGVLPRQDPASKPILAGILATHIGWTSIHTAAAQAAMRTGTPDEVLDFMVAANAGAVEKRADELVFAPSELRLAWLQVRLLKRLLALGTALPLDIDAYWDAIDLDMPRGEQQAGSSSTFPDTPRLPPTG